MRRLWKRENHGFKGKGRRTGGKIKNDPALLTQFRENPAAVVKKLIGVDLPEAQIRQAAELIKAKIDLDKASGLLGSLFGK